MMPSELPLSATLTGDSSDSVCLRAITAMQRSSQLLTPAVQLSPSGLCREVDTLLP